MSQSSDEYAGGSGVTDIGSARASVGMFIVVGDRIGELSEKFVLLNSSKGRRKES